MKNFNVKSFGRFISAARVNDNTMILHFQKATALQSYSTIVAAELSDGKVILDPYHDYSRITSKNVTNFIGANTSERRKGLESGRYILANLN